MKVNDLTPGDLLQFTDDSGPVPGAISDTLKSGYHHEWNDTLKIGSNFNWIWQEGFAPRHMIYVGVQKDTSGSVSYEVLWNHYPRSIEGKHIKHLELVGKRGHPSG